VLLERQVVIFCPNIGVLTSSVLALIPLVRPYAWQSLLLPVLPATEQMLDFLQARCPTPGLRPTRRCGPQHRTVVISWELFDDMPYTGNTIVLCAIMCCTNALLSRAPGVYSSVLVPVILCDVRV